MVARRLGQAFLRRKPNRLFTTATNDPRTAKPLSLRTRPILYITAFVLTHQLIATSSLFPAYYTFKSSLFGLDSGTFLGGPVAGRILKLRIPGRGGTTVEDLVEGGVRFGVVRGYGVFGRWKEKRASKGKEEDRRDAEEAAEEAVREFEALEGKPRFRDRVKAAANRGKDAVLAAGTEKTSWRSKLKLQTKDGETDVPVGVPEKRRFVDDVKMRDVMNVAAAWLTVKALFPVRLGLSMFLTPRFARVLARRL